MVVDKPAGLSVHNLEDPQNLLKVLEAQLAVKKLLPVHRLDKETSGVQILAFHPKAARQYAEQFEAKTTKKIYHGVLRGSLETPEGIWSSPLTDKAEGRKNPQGLSKDRVPCETQFKKLQTNNYFSLSEFHLLTGRQHQIRKHAAMARHAIVGDPRYNDPKYNQKIAKLYTVERMFLHCSQIEILDHVFKAEISTDFSILLS